VLVEADGRKEEDHKSYGGGTKECIDTLCRVALLQPKTRSRRGWRGRQKGEEETDRMLKRSCSDRGTGSAGRGKEMLENVWKLSFSAGSPQCGAGLERKE